MKTNKIIFMVLLLKNIERITGNKEKLNTISIPKDYLNEPAEIYAEIELLGWKGDDHTHFKLKLFEPIIDKEIINEYSFKRTPITKLDEIYELLKESNLCSLTDARSKKCNN